MRITTVRDGHVLLIGVEDVAPFWAVDTLGRPTQRRHWDAQGMLLQAYEMDHGDFVGEGRRWNRAGVLVLERDDATRRPQNM